METTENRTKHIVPNADRLRNVGGERATARLFALVAPSEQEALREIAEAEGCTVSTLVRRQVLMILERGPYFTGPTLEELRGVRSELSAMGRNLNQVARTLNILAFPQGVAGGHGNIDRQTVETLVEVIRGIIPAIGKTRDTVADLVSRSKGGS